MWRIWIASIDLRHKIRHPFALLTKAADAEPVLIPPNANGKLIASWAQTAS